MEMAAVCGSSCPCRLRSVTTSSACCMPTFNLSSFPPATLPVFHFMDHKTRLAVTLTCIREARRLDGFVSASYCFGLFPLATRITGYKNHCCKMKLVVTECQSIYRALV